MSMCLPWSKSSHYVIFNNLGQGWTHVVSAEYDHAKIVSEADEQDSDDPFEDFEANVDH